MSQAIRLLRELLEADAGMTSSQLADATGIPYKRVAMVMRKQAGLGTAEAGHAEAGRTGIRPIIWAVTAEGALAAAVPDPQDGEPPASVYGPREPLARKALRVVCTTRVPLTVRQIMEAAGDGGLDSAAPYASALSRYEGKGLAERFEPRPPYRWRGTAAGSASLSVGPPVTGRFRHGTQYGYTQKKCRCEDCREWAAVNYRKWADRNPGKAAAQAARLAQWRADRPEQSREIALRSREKRKRENSQLREMATRDGEPWAAEEKLAVFTPGMSLNEIAASLGRSARAVSSMRAILSADGGEDSWRAAAAASAGPGNPSRP